MKKTILIMFGTLIILGVVGVWAYVFTHGAPENSAEVFARFGLGNNTNTEVVPVPVNDTSTIDVEGETDTGEIQKLRQLTTRPVAGATFRDSGIMYVEQGTGHIYMINLDDGKETLINGTTIAQSAEAVFSADGTYVAITSYSALGNTVIVERTSMDNGEKEGITLPIGASQVAFAKASNTVLYLLKEAGGATGYSYNILKETSVALFSIPLRDIRVLWGTPTYVYTTPTATAVGFIYKIEGNSLAYVTGGGYGLMSLPYSEGIVITKSEGDGARSFNISQKSTSVNFPITIIPEKCISQRNTIYCAVPNRNIKVQTFPDNWYKGVISYTDILWSVNATTGASTVLSNFLTESGREVDVSKIGIDDAGKRIYFVNKNDNTLWMFDMTI